MQKVVKAEIVYWDTEESESVKKTDLLKDKKKSKKVCEIF